MLKKIYDSNIIAFFLLDKNIIIKDMNKKGAKLFGYKKEELMEQSVKMFYDSEEKYLEIRDLFKELENGKVIKKELRLKNKNGELFWLNLQGEKINDGFIWFLRNIEERKREEKNMKESEIKLEKIKKELQLLNKKKKNFSENLSHDLKTPLNAIIGFSDILIMEEDDKNKIEKLEKIKKAGLKLLKMQTGLIDYIMIDNVNLIKESNKLKSVKALIYETNEFNRIILTKICKSLEMKYEILTSVDMKYKKNIKYKFEILFYSVNENTEKEVENIKNIRNIYKIIIGDKKECEKFESYFEDKLSIPINKNELEEKLLNLEFEKIKHELEIKYKIDLSEIQKKELIKLLVSLRENCKFFNKKKIIEIGGEMLEISKKLENPVEEIKNAGENYDTEKLKRVIINIEKSIIDRR